MICRYNGAMRWPRLSLSLLMVSMGFCVLSGCMGRAGSVRPIMLGPARMQINPTFTRLSATGLQADIELEDAFGDPAKGGGAITFELFEYAASGTDIRGERIGVPVRFDLSTPEAQRAHWQPVVRTYRFELPWGSLSRRVPYLLMATYDPTAEAVGDTFNSIATTQPAQRLFDRHIIQPRPAE